MPIRFACVVAIFFHALWTKPEPLWEWNTTCHNTCTHMEGWSIPATHILAKTMVPFRWKKGRKKRKQRMFIYNLITLADTMRWHLCDEKVQMAWQAHTRYRVW